MVPDEGYSDLCLTDHSTGQHKMLGRKQERIPTLETAAPVVTI